MPGKLYGRGEIHGIEYTRDTIGRLYGIQEECDCSSCGCPLEVGDRAIMLENGDTFCSDSCMEKTYGSEDESDPLSEGL